MAARLRNICILKGFVPPFSTFKNTSRGLECSISLRGNNTTNHLTHTTNQFSSYIRSYSSKTPSLQHQHVHHQHDHEKHHHHHHPTPSSSKPRSHEVSDPNELAGTNPRCWSCDRVVEGALPHLCHGCHVIQPLPKDKTFFELFEFAPTFDLDPKRLAEKYKSLQRRYHPDSFHTKSKKEQEISATQSAAVNHAYTVLKKPHLRAQYLLSLKGIKFEDEGTLTDPELLMEVMETRELIESTSSRDEIISIGHANKTAMDECNRKISEMFRKGELMKAKDYIIRLQYLHRIHDAVEEKVGMVVN